MPTPLRPNPDAAGAAGAPHPAVPAPDLWVGRWDQRLVDDSPGAGAESPRGTFDDAAAWLAAEVQRNLGRWAHTDKERDRYVAALDVLRTAMPGQALTVTLPYHTLAIKPAES